MPHNIYLDHAATTQPDRAVLAAMMDAAEQAWGNPSSPHRKAVDGRRIHLQAARLFAECLNCDDNQIFCTSGGTESNAMAFWQARGRHVVISAIEHASVPEAAENYGCEITLVKPGRDGAIRAEDIASAIRPDTAMVSVMAANNETGVIQPVAEIGRLCREKHILYHCDAVQAFGQIPIDVAACKIDLLSASGHKIYGPRGIGLLYIGDRVNAAPLIAGSQQRGLRGGTENTPAIAGVAKAAEIALAEMRSRSEKAAGLRQLLRKKLGEDNRFRFPGDDAGKLPGILNVILPNIESEVAIAQLDLIGICVSGGAACGSPGASGSHVLKAMGYTPEEAKRALRISIGKDNTEEEILVTAEAIKGLCG